MGGDFGHNREVQKFSENENDFNSKNQWQLPVEKFSATDVMDWLDSSFTITFQRNIRSFISYERI